MEKIRLDLDQLTVESFESDGGVVAQERPTNSEPSLCRTCEGDRICFTINCC